MSRTHLVPALGILLLSALAGLADDTAQDYARQIKPILRARCYACHGALQQQSALRLDTVASMVKGGDSGPAVVPGDSGTSPLVERIASAEPGLRMPPEGQPLSPDQIARITAWIEQGAAVPADEQPEPDPADHWAFRQPTRPELPRWQRPAATRHPIDAFVLAKLEERGLDTRPPAERHVLLRRVYLDLIGVPPTREELHAFLADCSPDAYEKVVDRLLDDPRHGERWARHWMDVWRYSDWYGRRHVPDVWNSAPQIWRWRDWIVRSVNADHGYDRMLGEMLAGDELAPASEEACFATGFLIRNWYALNPNDWMRANVEHTGKAFLGLTFNCAHCHDHKYDPISQEDYFRLRAFFEPIHIRQDRVAGEADPGPFQDYEYSTLRRIQRLGGVRVFDKAPQAPTWFYTGGDERNRMTERGSLPPGVPAFLNREPLRIEPVELPPRAWYPGLRPAIQETVLAEARAAITAAEAETAAAKEAGTEPSVAAREQLASAEAAYAAAQHEHAQAAVPRAPVGQQALLLDATTGRRVVQNRLPGLKQLEHGFTVEFQLLLVTDAHVNFQFAKDVVQGLTAGYLAFDAGRILSYQPGSFTEIEVGRYDFARGQKLFQVTLVLETGADRCLLTVRSLPENMLLVDGVPVALNGWNPVGDSTKGISFDARTGSVAMIDELILTAPPAADAPAGAMPARVAHFDFESPAYPEGRDVVGLGSWEASPFSVAPATSSLATSIGHEPLRAARQQLDAARRIAQAPLLRRQAAEAQEVAARAQLSSVEARIAADRARYGEGPADDANALIRAASRLEREAEWRKAEANCLAREYKRVEAEAKPASDANRNQEIDAANQALAAARAAADAARAGLASESLAESYSTLSPTYPQSSTGRRQALAAWITGRNNPLTARVAVNHIWLRHFHAPLVASVYDFGRNGARPTHPELLDWLAVELMESGWSMKHLHRLIVTSDAYRRVSSVGAAAHEAALDPENHLLWRMNTGRMEAEVVRDSLLYCAGRLDLRMGGQELENEQALKSNRRSLYYSVYPEEGGKSPLGELFDAPDPLDCYRRTQSIVPQQALVLTNSDLVHELSAAIVGAWEARSADEQPAQDHEFMRVVFEQVLSRAPTDKEQQLCRDALEKQYALLTAANTASAATRARESLVRALLNHNDFVTIR